MANFGNFKRYIELCTPPIFGIIRKKLHDSKKYRLYSPFDNVNIDSKAVEVVFDIGANIGLISQNAYKSFPNAKVYSFEPVSATFEKLEQNTRRYRERIFPFQLGFFNESKKMPIYITSFSGANSIIKQSRDHKRVHSDQDLKEVSEEIIELTTLDSFVQTHKISAIDILKIDVEGVEKEVLLGGREIIREKIKYIFIELSLLRRNRESSYWIEICQLLYDAGFELVTIYDVAKYVEDGQEYLAQLDAVFRRKNQN
jgi:FkbM family methyltransferase